MKKILTLILITITSVLLIYKPTNKINIIKAEINNISTPTTANQTFKIINPYIQYETYNFYNESDILIFAGYNQNTISNSTRQYLMTQTEIIRDPTNNKQREIAIAGIRIDYDATNLKMRTTIKYLSLDINSTGTSTQAIYITYDQNTENGQITPRENSSVNFTMLGVYNTTELMQKEWTTSENWTTLWTNYENTWGQARIHFVEQFLQRTGVETLQAPTLTMNYNTLQWNIIENATYYNIYKNGNLYAQTTINEFTTIENGTYQVEAGTNLEGYQNSILSNEVVQERYNDLIGNGFNFFTMFTAIIDAQIYLIESFLNYEVWGINFYDIFQLLITIALIIIIIKFAIKQKG